GNRERDDVMKFNARRRSGTTWMIAAVVVASVTMHVASASAFCGFYVAKADAKLYNKASKIVLVRDGDRTVLTIANDFKGDPKEFAVVIPVPTVLEREQIHVGEIAVVDHLDAFTAPRLVEYFDPDPCARPEPALPMAAFEHGVVMGAEMHVRGG